MFQGQQIDSLSFSDVSVRQCPSIFNTVHSPRDILLNVSYVRAYEMPVYKLQPSRGKLAIKKLLHLNLPILALWWQKKQLKEQWQILQKEHQRFKLCLYLIFLPFFSFR